MGTTWGIVDVILCLKAVWDGSGGRKEVCVLDGDAKNIVGRSECLDSLIS